MLRGALEQWLGDGRVLVSCQYGTHVLEPYGVEPEGRGESVFYKKEKARRHAICNGRVIVSAKNLAGWCNEDIVAFEGPRRPTPVTAPKSFRTAFVLVSMAGQKVSPKSVNQLDRYRRRWMSYFQEVTGHRGTVRTALVPR